MSALNGLIILVLMFVVWLVFQVKFIPWWTKYCTRKGKETAARIESGESKSANWLENHYDDKSWRGMIARFLVNLNAWYYERLKKSGRA